MRPGSRSAAQSFAVEAEAGAHPLVRALAAAGRELDGGTTARPEFRTGLRARLLAPAVDPVPHARRPHLRRRLGVAAVVVVVALWAMFELSTRSLPGQPLYGAKRSTEEVQLLAVRGTLPKGIRHLRLAERRLHEVRALSDRRHWAGSGGRTAASGSRATHVSRTLAAMDQATWTGGGLVVQAVRDSGDPAPLTVLQKWSGAQAARIRAAEPALPAASRERADASILLIDVILDTARSQVATR